MSLGQSDSLCQTRSGEGPRSQTVAGRRKAGSLPGAVVWSQGRRSVAESSSEAVLMKLGFLLNKDLFT